MGGDATLRRCGSVGFYAHRKRQLDERMHKAGLWKDHDLVFPSSVGTPLSHPYVVRSFKALLLRADLPSSIRLYDLRHTCATLLLSRNVHPKICAGASRARLHNPDAGHLQPHHRRYGRRHDRRYRGGLGLGTPSSVAAPLLQRGPGHTRGLIDFPTYSAYLWGIKK
jgi:hypothetical protein